MEKLNEVFMKFREFITNRLSKISTDTLGWLSILCLHAATVPSFFALMTGITDRPPSVDVVLIVWVGLFLAFLRSVILKDMLNVITIGVGFMIQATMLALIFLK
jgi:hypothetical protein